MCFLRLRAAISNFAKPGQIFKKTRTFGVNRIFSPDESDFFCLTKQDLIFNITILLKFNEVLPYMKSQGRL